MTRPGDASERRRRIRLGYTPGADGTLHSPQPVEPEGRRKRRKASGHKHTEGQPPEDHGASHDADGADPNPHTESANPHSGSASTSHDHDDRYAPNSHGDGYHTKATVENVVGSPARYRDTRANQPAPGDVQIGAFYTVEDENDTREVAADTTGDGAADSWLAVPDQPHRDDTANPHSVDHSQLSGVGSDDHHAQVHGDADHSRDYDAAFVADAGATPQDQAGTRANQPAADAVPVGSRYWVTDEQVYERSNGTSWEAVAAEPGAHGNDQHTAGSIPTFLVASSVAPQHIINAADYTASGADDQMQINTALVDLPGGSKTGS